MNPSPMVGGAVSWGRGWSGWYCRQHWPVTGAYIDHAERVIQTLRDASGGCGRTAMLGSSTHEAFCPNIWHSASWALGDHSKQMTDDRITKSTAPSIQQLE